MFDEMLQRKEDKDRVGVDRLWREDLFKWQKRGRRRKRVTVK